MEKEFDTTLRDSQSTTVEPVAPEKFDLDAYAAYEASMGARQEAFLHGDASLLVYRRVRADGVFYDKCRDYRESLALQLVRNRVYCFLLRGGIQMAAGTGAGGRTYVSQRAGSIGCGSKAHS